MNKKASFQSNKKSKELSVTMTINNKLTLRLDNQNGYPK